VSAVKAKAVNAQARVELVLTARRGEGLIVSFAIPIGVLIFFAKVGGDAFVPKGERPIDFLVPGILALAVMSTAMVSLGIATGFERRYGVLKRLGATPLTRIGLLTAKTINVLVIEVVQFVLIVVAGLALGWHAPSGLIATIPIMLLGTIAFAGIGLYFAGTLRAEANLALANGLFLVLLFIGDMAYPLSKLPGWLSAIAQRLPAAALATCMRDLLEKGRSFPTGSLGVLIVWAVVMPVIAARSFTWEE
jgi:ABC-2 type transport system permease protein